MRSAALVAALAALAVALTALAAAAGCAIGDHPFVCTDDTSCGPGGACEATARCSLADTACADSGRRYAGNAGEALAGQCVPACVTDLVAGGDSTCALLVDGRALCWGDNRTAQLGLGAADDEPHPLPGPPGGIQGGLALGDLAIGPGHACAVSAGDVVCWGDNASGQVTAAASATVETAPRMAAAGDDVTVGLRHSCAIQTSGQVLCWGENARGQLGPNDKLVHDMPVTVVRGDDTPLTGVREIAAYGDATCSLTSAAPCWGGNERGELGNGSVTDNDNADQAGIISGLHHVAMGDGHGCCGQDDTVQCWGDNAFGQLGRDVTPDHNLPGAVVGLPGGVSGVAAGNDHTCVIVDADGTVWCWGDNREAQLGRGGQGDFTPAAVAGLAGAQAIAAGRAHTCVLVEGGRVFCWGAGARGQLGDGATTTRSEPRLARIECPAAE